jgi:hypothetical protein
VPAVIEKADPRIRALVVTALAAIAAIGVVFIASADTWRSAVTDWVLRDPARTRSRAVGVTVAVAGAVIVPVAGMAAYLWRFSAGVMRDRRFPPHGTRLIVDMIVQEGEEALRRGRILHLLALGLGATSLVFAIMFWRLIMMTRSAP